MDYEEEVLTSKETQDLQNNPAYRQWLVRAKANVIAVKLLEKFCECGDQGDSDDGFEDMQDDNNEDGIHEQSQIDLDKVKESGWKVVSSNGFLQSVLNLSTAIPLFDKLPESATTVLQELTQQSYSFLTNISFSYPEKVSFDLRKTIISNIFEHIKEGNLSSQDPFECLDRVLSMPQD